MSDEHLNYDSIPEDRKQIFLAEAATVVNEAATAVEENLRLGVDHDRQAVVAEATRMIMLAAIPNIVENGTTADLERFIRDFPASNIDYKYQDSSPDKVVHEAQGIVGAEQSWLAGDYNQIGYSGGHGQYKKYQE